jgi:integrase
MYHEGVVAKQFMRWCVSRGLLLESCIEAYRLVKPPKSKKSAPTLAQFHKILAQCHPAVRNRILTLLVTGLRVGELQALGKSDVDLRAGFISVAKQLSGPTKTGMARRVPIHPMLRPVLRKQLAADDHELLFTAEPSSKYPQGGHHFNPKRLNDSFKAAVHKAGLKGFTLHSLRHVFASHSINNGTPERVVRAWLGHCDRSVTGGYYHLTDAESYDFMNRLSFDAPNKASASADEAAPEEPNDGKDKIDD